MGKKALEGLPEWSELAEVSAGVYKVNATHRLGRAIEFTTHADEDQIMKSVEKEARKIQIEIDRKLHNGLAGKFVLLGPQQVRHSSGYIVQVNGRFQVGYIEGIDVASVEVEFGPTTAVYDNTLALEDQGGAKRVLTPARCAEILERIRAGLIFMGCTPDAIPPNETL